jgi:hypothetical protein
MFQLGRSVSSAELPPTAPPESFAPLAEGAIDASIKADLETTATALREWFATHPTSTQPVWSASFAPAVHAGNHIDLKLTPGVAGFCLDGWNSAGTATGPWAKQFYYYDSLAGGLQIGGPSAVPPSMASAGSACAGNYGFRPIA